MTRLYTSHYMEEVEQLCRYIAIIDHGRILCADEAGGLLASGAGQSLQAELDRAPAPSLRRTREERCRAHFDTVRHLTIQDNPARRCRVSNRYCAKPASTCESDC
ncbi:MAG: hypothetical protein P8011_12060 [Acidihalobacter sp.]